MQYTAQPCHKPHSSALPFPQIHLQWDFSQGCRPPWDTERGLFEAMCLGWAPFHQPTPARCPALGPARTGCSPCPHPQPCCAGEPPSHLPWRLRPRDLHFPVEFPWIYKRAGFDLQSLTMVVNLDCDQIRPEHELAVISGAKWPLAWKIIFIGFLLHLHSFSCMLWLCLCWGGISRITGVSNPDGLHPFYHLAGARGAFKGEEMFFRPSPCCHSSNMSEAVFPKA